MNNDPYDEIRIAHIRAKELMRAADDSAASMAELLCGRLRHARPWTLARLKRELRDFNIHTEEWKE